MPRTTMPSPAVSRAAVMVATVLVVAALYLAREVLIPFTLAILFAFLLNPLVARVRRWGVGHLPAVAIVCSLALVFVIVIAGFLTLQAVDLLDRLPAYAHHAQDRFEVLL